MFKNVRAAFIIASLACVAFSTPSVAQQHPSSDEIMRQLESLNWIRPGSIGRIADKAEFVASDKYTYLNSRDTNTYLELNGNPPRPEPYAVATREGNWWAILEFEHEGYVKDDEKIDASALLNALKEANVVANEQRRSAGYPSLHLEGWQFPPRYDPATNRLEWGTRFVDDQGQPVVNVSTKLLGRSGYTTVTLVTSPQTVNEDLVDFKHALRNFEYVDGEKYSEWKQGDRVAAYGLGALVLGGAAAVATSKGGFKIVGAAILAALAGLWAGVKRLFGKKK